MRAQVLEIMKNAEGRSIVRILPDDGLMDEPMTSVDL